MPYKFFILALVFCGCTDDSAARRTLEAHGFSEIQITGWSPMACSDSDTTSTGFHAKNPKGQVVSGVVCCGLVFKNCTVRF